MNKELMSLTPTEEFRKNLNKFKEVFIEFYGENKREEIEEKFSKMLPIAYTSPDNLNTKLINIEDKFTDKLIKIILSNRNTILTKEDFLGNYSFEYQILHPIYKYQKFYEYYCLGPDGIKQKFIDNGYENITQELRNLTKDEYYKIIEEKSLPEKYQMLPERLKDNFKYYMNEKYAIREYQRIYKDAEPLLKKIIPEIELSKFNDYTVDERLIELNRILEDYKNALKEYEKLKNSLADFYVQNELIKENKLKLQTKYHKNIIKEFKYLIPKEKQINIEEYLKGEKEDYSLDDYVKYIFGNSLYSTYPLEFFTTESDETLNNTELANWRKDEIINSRIEYFKKNGIDLGNDYESYLKNPSVQAIWPSKDLADSFIEYKNKCLNDFNNEFYTSTEEYKKRRLEIDNLNLLDKNDSFNASIYTNSQTFVAPNIRINNNIKELFSLLIISFDNYTEGMLDHFIVHELNHIFELSSDLIGEESYTVTCGWDIFNSSINQSQEEVDTISRIAEKRPYELFNEIINELIAQDISKIMHDKKIYIFDEEKNSKYKHTTSYEHSLFLVKDFFTEFKDKIIESRSNGNIKIIWDEVGKDNFDELNNLFTIYNENFSELKIYNLICDLKENKDTPLTRLYHDLVNKKDSILENMHKFKASKTTTYEEKLNSFI